MDDQQQQQQPKSQNWWQEGSVITKIMFVAFLLFFIVGPTFKGLAAASKEYQ